MTVLCRLCRRPLDLAPSDGDRHLNCPHEEPRDTHGPSGTYGCACVSRHAKVCMLVRYGYAYLDAEEQCECLCHQWDDEDEDDEDEL